jgi:hypothetical protein
MLKGGLPGHPVTGAGGATMLVEGTLERWNQTLSDPDTRDCFVQLAAMAAGGVVAEMEMGYGPNDPAHRPDILSIGQVAAALGLGRSSAEKPVQDFINAAYKRAEEVLNEGRRARLAFGGRCAPRARDTHG